MAQIVFDFTKTTISSNVISLFENRIIDENEKEWFAKVVKGSKLKNAEANQLVKSILQAMFIQTDEEQEEVTIPVTDNLDDDASLTQVLKNLDPKTVSTPPPVITEDFPTLAQSMVKWTLIGSNGKKVAEDHIIPPKSNPSTSKLNGDELLHMIENACYFYKIGKCRFGKECKKDHPKFCQKFVNCGPIKNNPKGCDSKCYKLHPIACRDSVKNRECSRDKCRFFHLAGTKKPDTPISFQPVQIQPNLSVPIQNQVQVLPQNFSHAQTQQYSPPGLSATSPAQVFQVDQTEVVQMLKQMMEEMRSWRNPNPLPVQPQLMPQLWSLGSQAPQLGWGSPSNLNPSQSQSQ